MEFFLTDDQQVFFPGNVIYGAFCVRDYAVHPDPTRKLCPTRPAGRLLLVRGRGNDVSPDRQTHREGQRIYARMETGRGKRNRRVLPVLRRHGDAEPGGGQRP